MSSSGVDLLVTELATEATSLWSLGQHDAALQTLQRLEGLLPTDPKVQINEWVAGYYAESYTSLDALSEQLAAWLDKNVAGNAATRTAYTTAAVNYGILLYVQQQHSKALTVLEPLYNDVESMHGGAALCMCVLLLEIYLSSSQLPKAAQVLHYLQATTTPDVLAQAAFCDDVTEDASSSQARDAEHLSQQQAPWGWRHEQQQHSPKPTLKKVPQHAASPSRLPPHQQQQASPRLWPTMSVDQQQDRQQHHRDPEQPTGPLSLNLPMVTRCTSAFMQQVVQVVEQQGGQIANTDIPALLHLYKARLAIACSNHKAAKKEVKALLALQPSSLTAMLCKAQLEVMRQQPKKALKTLAPVLSAAGDCSTRYKLQLLNVLAAIHQQLGKHHVAALYLSSALTQHQQAMDKQQGPQRLQDSNQQQPQRQVGKQQQQCNACKQQQGKQQPIDGHNAGKAIAPIEADTSRSSAAAGAALSAGAAADAPQGPRDSWQLLLDSNDALQYNMGLQQLALHNWHTALECFEVASCTYYTQPQLWLRMAEALVSLYHEQQEAQQAPQQQRQQQQHQRQQQLPVLIHIGKQDGSSSSSSSSSSRGKSPCDAAISAAGVRSSALLQQAADHLSTGLSLLRQRQAQAAKQAEEAAVAVTAAAVAAAAVAGEQQVLVPLVGVSSTSGWLNNIAPHLSVFNQRDYAADAAASTSTSVADIAAGSSSAAAAADVAAASAASGVNPLGACIVPQTSAALQQSLLANQAYVYLLLQQPQQALEAAKALLACSSMSPQQHYLGSCYAAEALCMLGRVDEAAEQLQGHMALYMSNTQVSSSGGGSGTATPSSLVAAAKATAGEFGCSSQPTAQHAGDWYAAGTGVVSVAGGVFQASSIVSDDDSSCVGCKGVWSGGHGQPGAGNSTQRYSQVAVLCNMSSVLALQGDVQESRRYAAMAVAEDPNCAAANVVLGWSGFPEIGHQQ